MTSAVRQIPSTLAELTALLGTAPGFADAVNALHSGRSATIDGAWGSSCALGIAAIVAADRKRCHIAVLPTIRDAEEFVDELSDLTKSTVLLFPAWESLPEAIDAGDAIYAARLSVVRRLNEQDRTPTLIVTCVPALLQPVPARDEIKAATRTLSVGDELQLDELIEWLIARGFERVTAVEMPGEFCIHGGILDIFPASEPDAIRIELFGDEIESIRSFNVESQRRLEDLKRISLTATAPAASAPNQNNTGKAQKSKTSAVAASPIFAGATESLIDYLPPSTVVVLNDLQQSISEGRMYLQRLSNPVGLYSVDATMARLTEFP
ncbi:MAG TPA: transcription-repair coupling factor, partial [Planctomycetaceae bacterium]|nr:transcription-repair coupling factor [Planctomycetaceae bacterium]